MATKDVTSRRVGTIASKQLSNPRSGSAAKSTAGSALAQRPDRKRAPRKRG
jgi:hypothetical protein